MLSILLIITFLFFHTVVYRIFKINIINLTFIICINILIIFIFNSIKYKLSYEFVFLILLSLNSFIFCYAIFFTGVINDSPTLKIIYYLYVKKIKSKKKLESKFVKSKSIELRIGTLNQNKLFFKKKKNKFMVTKKLWIILNIIKIIERVLKLKSDV